jgi:hypothetical protein
MWAYIERANLNQAYLNGLKRRLGRLGEETDL